MGRNDEMSTSDLQKSRAIRQAQEENLEEDKKEDSGGKNYQMNTDQSPEHDTM
jgi:hypothetical protein